MRPAPTPHTSYNAGGADPHRYVIVWRPQGRCARCRRFVSYFPDGRDRGTFWCATCSVAVDARRYRQPRPRTRPDTQRGARGRSWLP